eukprot:3818387-Alexandrium_andersonii.AAC.1
MRIRGSERGNAMLHHGCEQRQTREATAEETDELRECSACNASVRICSARGARRACERSALALALGDGAWAPSNGGSGAEPGAA